MNEHKSPGCETMPTRGFDSKPANDDGLVHWCDVSRKAAEEQELLRDPHWQRPTSTPKERAAIERYLRDHEVDVLDAFRQIGQCGFDGICTRKVDANGNCPEHGQPAWALERRTGRQN